MSTRGFWRDSEHKATKGNRHFDAPAPKIPQPRPPTGRFDPYSIPEGTWRDHPDQAATARALVSKCQKPKEPRHDS